jgi:hypothetical protein
MSTLLEFVGELVGKVSLIEANVKQDMLSGCFDNRALLECTCGSMHLESSIYKQDEYGNSVGPYLELEIACYDVQNEETGRRFHCRLNARLDREQARQLHGYIGYLFDHEWPLKLI